MKPHSSGTSPTEIWPTSTQQINNAEICNNEKIFEYDDDSDDDDDHGLLPDGTNGQVLLDEQLDRAQYSDNMEMDKELSPTGELSPYICSFYNVFISHFNIIYWVFGTHWLILFK